MSWGEHKTQSPLDGSDVLTHKQDDSAGENEEGSEGVETGGEMCSIVLQSYN